MSRLAQAKIAIVRLERHTRTPVTVAVQQQGPVPAGWDLNQVSGAVCEFSRVLSRTLLRRRAQNVLRCSAAREHNAGCENA